MTPETRAKLSEQKKRHWADPEYRAKIVASSSETSRRRYADPEQRAKVSGANNYAWVGEDWASVASVHTVLRRTYPKSGVCDECGKRVGTRRPGGTEYAFKYHPQRHTRNREDYRELCPPCHRRFDKGGRR